MNPTHYHIQLFTIVLKRQPLLAGKKTYALVLKAPLTHVLNPLDKKTSKLPINGPKNYHRQNKICATYH